VASQSVIFLRVAFCASLFTRRFLRIQVLCSPGKEAAEMTTPPHILSVGKDPTLMSSRSLILRDAGYLVDEAYSVDKAINLVEADSIDAVLICHTVPRNDQQALISTVRKKRRLMPVLCIRSYAYESAPQTCIAIDNEPEVLLNTVKMVTKPPTSH
jgi:CheY-like chemotaxis protein